MSKLAIRLPFMASKSSDPASATKPSKAYGAVLRAARERLGLTLKELGQKADVDKLTVMCNETGYDERSLKATIKIRDTLIALGESLPPIAMGDDEPAAPVVATPMVKLSDESERIRWNVVRFRESLDIDARGAAFVCKVPLREWLRIEDGETEPSGVELARIAKVFGCTIDDLVNLNESDPVPKLKLTDDDDLSARYHRTVGLLTAAEQEQLEKLHASMRARAAAEHASGRSPRDPAKAKIAKKR